MQTSRSRSLEAAIELVGTEGLRALTHARVDERAGLPRGSTSNYFRTRAALVDGVVEWVAQRELADFDPAALPTTADELVNVLCAGIELQTGTFRTRTVARYSLFLEGARRAGTRAQLVANRHRFEQWSEAILTSLGAADPAAAARTLMASSEGLVLHRLTVDPDAPLRPSVAMIVRACLEATPRAATLA
jgi:DNA-binding transcriptional regulator YbjK